MKQFRSYLRAHPAIASVITLVAFTVCSLAAGIVLVLLPGIRDEWTQLLIGEAVTALGGIGLLILFGLFYFLRVRRVGFFRGLLVGGYLLLLALASFLLSLSDYLGSEERVAITPGRLLQLIVLCFLVGFCEEVFFRGIIGNLFLLKYGRDACGVWIATVASGLFFGVYHLTNLLSGSDQAGVLVQVPVALFLGMFLTAVYYRTRNLWVPIALHALYDFAGFAGVGLFSDASVTDQLDEVTVFAVLPGLICLALLPFLYRKSKMREIAWSTEESQTTTKRRLRILLYVTGGVVLLSLMLFCLIDDDPVGLNAVQDMLR